jgi:YggT family protein
MSPLLGFIAWIINLYIVIVVVDVILSWLIVLDVISRRNHAVYMITDLFHRLTAPALRPIRSRLPELGGLDISPLILILLLVFIRDSLLGRSLWSFIADIIGIYITILVIHVILSWLLALDVISRRNPIVYAIADMFHRLTEPALRPIRNRLPDFGGLDISPLILILLLLFITNVVIVWLRMRIPI